MPTILEKTYKGVQLSSLSIDKLKQLAEELRQELLTTVSRQGGHLASNLGVLELVLALHVVFDLSKDRLFFDTGHQCYVHKILSGRLQAFQKLRATDGCCGFPLRSESEFDAFGVGHSGTAISAALGYAFARDRRHSGENVIALVGDGALGSGCSLEGLNNIAVTTKRFLLLLNDNKMSIAPNVGAISRFLNRIISGRRYNTTKRILSTLVKNIPFVGSSLQRIANKLEYALKSFFIHRNMFGDLGLKYIGPVNGHNLEELIPMLERIKHLDVPVVLHVLTQKGNGYAPAEASPSAFHGVQPFDLKDGMSLNKTSSITFSKAFGEAILNAREKDSSIVAITAGMPDGTGLKPFSQKYPESFVDVGIAEECGTSFAAGLATAGFKPVFALYASFSQRAFDFFFTDAWLQKLPVVMCLDRAGVVADGPTHHGIMDIAFWRTMPGVTIMQPSDANEVAMMLSFALASGMPAILRYPSGNASNLLESHAELTQGRAEVVEEGSSLIAIWAVGRELETALNVSNLLKKRKLEPTIVNARFVFPFDKELMQRQIQDGMRIVIIENHLATGGFASIVRDELPEAAQFMQVFAWESEDIPWGNVKQLRERFSFTPEAIAEKILKSFDNRRGVNDDGSSD
ncbi:MAG: 1-deoxy-D-xylulose-5-phosphate synthase [Victivallales bacterium]|nr:1-deoxy-D-xylulose-5-phosphate synthase [Victivallales bacterium]